MNIIKNKILKLSIIWTLLFGFTISNAAGMPGDWKFFLNAGKKIAYLPKVAYLGAAGAAKAVKGRLFPKKRFGDGILRSLDNLNKGIENSNKKIQRWTKDIIAKNEAKLAKNPFTQFYRGYKKFNVDRVIEAKAKAKVAKKFFYFSFLDRLNLDKYKFYPVSERDKHYFDAGVRHKGYYDNLMVVRICVGIPLLMIILGLFSYVSLKNTCPYCNNYYGNCTCAPLVKIRNACANHIMSNPVDRCKSLLRDTNVGMNDAIIDPATGQNRKLLHFVCANGRNERLDVVKWMVEEKFANVSDLENNQTPRQSFAGAQLMLNVQLPVGGMIFLARPFDLVYNYLQDKENKQQDLITRVDTLKNDLDNYEVQIAQDVLRQRVQEIRNLVVDREVPGYAKQLVMPKLVEIHRYMRVQNLIDLEEMKELFRQISFNKNFVNEQQFKVAFDFALNDVEIKDIENNSALGAAAIYGDGETGISNFLETKGSLYVREKLFGDLITKVSGRQVAGQNAENIKEIDDLGSVLVNLKANNKKKEFRGILNSSIILSDLRKEITVLDESGVGKEKELPDVLAAKIMSFAGVKDFGNKIYGNL